MNLELKIINPLRFNKWDDVVIATRLYSFFHSSAWARVLIESYKYQPYYFALMNKDKLSVLVPLMEVKSFFTGKRGVSLPFSDSCFPIIEGNINFKDVLDHIFKYGKKRNWKYFEIRGGQEFLQDISPYLSFYSHILDLSQDELKVFSGFRDSTKRNIRKALKKGVKVDINKSLDSINKFYQLHCITRKSHGLPPQPYYFFKNIYDFVISRGFGFVVLASYKKRTVAGAVFFHFGEKAFYKFAASNKAYQHLRPSNLVMWEGIKWYCKNGYETFCFGRTEIENEGLQQFKRGWSTKENIIKYYRFDVKKGTVMKRKQGGSGIQNKIFNKMPINLLKFIGSLSYKHIG